MVATVVLAFQGFTTHRVGASAEPHDASSAQAPLASARPILAARGDRLLSVQPPPGRRVALTFDDGPDPRWTPQIAAELHRAGVPATFFVVGSLAARRPDLIRELVRDGDEIGNHTFTHTSLSNGPLRQRRLQIELTEATLAGITGHYSRMLRPPYSATSDAVSPRQERDLSQLAGRRYLIALADFDSEDWQRHGVASIVAHASPPGTAGGIVMLHDGGGNRSQTVAAVRALIPVLRARGFRFVSLSQLAGLPATTTEPAAGDGPRRRGQVFDYSVRMAYVLIGGFSTMMIVIGVIAALRALLLVALAAHHTRRARGRAVIEHVPDVAVIVPAFNEAVGIQRAVRSFAESDYPHLEIIVVDDGSTDDTAALVIEQGLEHVRLIRQDNAGKATALNTGVRHSAAEILVMVDGDTLFEPATVRRLVSPLADPQVGAVSGNTKVGNRRSLLGKWQHIEYVMGFNLDRRMYEVLQCTPTVPGAIGAFRRDVLQQVGGVPTDTLAEDTDLTLAIGRTGSRVVYAEEARAWTEAPSTLSSLWRQRYRWSFGTMQAIWKHRSALVSRDPRQANIGRRALPYLVLFQVLLPIASPLIDLFALYGLIFTDPVRVIVIWSAFNVIQLGIAAFGFRLDREPMRPLWTLPLQQFVYRQLMYLVVIEAIVSALRGARSGWKHIPRTGDAVIGAADAGSV